MEKIVLDTVRHGDDFAALIQSGGYVPLEITGTSMMPLLRPARDVVWLKASAPEMLKRGRILLFRRPDGSFILHRIRRCRPDGRLMMNGDAQRWCEIISPDAVVAIVEELTIRGRRISWCAPLLRFWDALWYPTRPFRPMLIRIYSGIKSCLRKQ